MNFFLLCLYSRIILVVEWILYMPKPHTRQHSLHMCTYFCVQQISLAGLLFNALSGQIINLSSLFTPISLSLHYSPSFSATSDMIDIAFSIQPHTLAASFSVNTLWNLIYEHMVVFQFDDKGIIVGIEMDFRIVILTLVHEIHLSSSLPEQHFHQNLHAILLHMVLD